MRAPRMYLFERPSVKVASNKNRIGRLKCHISGCTHIFRTGLSWISALNQGRKDRTSGTQGAAFIPDSLTRRSKGGQGRGCGRSIATN